MPSELNVDIDMDAALASMGNEFGGTGGEGDGGSPPQEPTSSVAPSTARAAPAGTPLGAPAAVGEVPQPAEWDQLPKSWKKELEPHWKGMTPQARQYVYEREKQALDGLHQYKDKADKWEKTLEPFQKFMQENKLDPYESVKRLGAVELVLRHGNEQEKAAYLGEMIRFYGLAPIIGQLMGQQPGGAQQGLQRDPLVGQLQQELADMKAWREEQSLNLHMQTIEAFVADPKNQFAGELLADMSRLIGNGSAKGLPSAYEQAMWLNPDVRSKVLAAEVAKATTASAPKPRLVRSSNTPVAPTEQAAGSMEDTLRATHAKIMARS